MSSLGPIDNSNEDFLQMEDVTVVVKKGFLGSPDRKTSIHTKEEHVNCENPLCKNGGIYIGKFLPEMIKNKKDGKNVRCPGYENMGRGQTRTCQYMFTLQVQNQSKELEIEKEN